ncbi:CMP-N-acetylneuraminate-beta-galactosamide-alpha-2,3-sialyltransferase 1-like [Conger conger]|uniref:CMP-N-acetylneuraminate-beta-galactosamide- alpha-2,3-sialyltransferase 1-like n=1 Tax=Conger conger TaxID=82655 RepID=UPI002A5AA7B6|nr:CMP-N-acetylneuraminate-beta-galactosamide-alpha-2,3-sialyltransferase 1-like [Conger conger]
MVDQFLKFVHFVCSPQTTLLERDSGAPVPPRLPSARPAPGGDQGPWPSVLQSLLEVMLSALEAKTQLLSSFHPQTAGQTERTSQEPAKTLRCLVEKSLPSWEASLPWVEDAHHCSSGPPFLIVDGNVTSPFPQRTSRALCACRQCISVEDEDPWFMKRFNTSISPLLSQKNAMLSDDTFKWWQRLQTKQNANYSAVVQKLFQVVPGEGHYNDSGPNRCRTCAVVGNSGNLKGSDYGALIDSNDFIIRMNKAPILGYEKDVGNRTTHRVMYPESATNLQKDTSLLLIPFKTLDLEWITSALTTGTVKRTRMPVMAKINADKNKVLIYNPTFLKYVYDVWLERHGKYPSTGFSTLMFAIHVCDEVNVFGFGASKDGTWQHYWEKNKFKRTKPTGVHAGDYESMVMKLLACEKKLKLFEGR